MYNIPYSSSCFKIDLLLLLQHCIYCINRRITSCFLAVIDDTRIYYIFMERFCLFKCLSWADSVLINPEWNFSQVYLCRNASHNFSMVRCSDFQLVSRHDHDVWNFVSESKRYCNAFRFSCILSYFLLIGLYISTC